jgi:hypothetical protein
MNTFTGRLNRTKLANIYTYTLKNVHVKGSRMSKNGTVEQEQDTSDRSFVI